MWSTIDETKQLTGIDVTLETIAQAQGIIESYVGRIEPEVTGATDIMLLGRATAYQAAYMIDSEDTIFGSPDVQQMMQFGNMITYRGNNTTSPWVSPLAVIACQRLSWKRIRSVRTGRIFDRGISDGYGWSKD